MRWFRAIACALVAILANMTVVPAEAETVVRWVTPKPPLTWDPQGSDETYTLNGQRQVYESLTRIGADLHLAPVLATSWRLVDPTTWRFELRRDVRFHDGSLLTAEDVVFSLDRAGGEGSEVKDRVVASIKGAVAVDTSTVEVRTKYPDLLLPVRFRTLFIVSRAWAETHGVAAATRWDKDRGTYARDHAMGTGPFRLVEHNPGGRTVLERNPDWWGAGEHLPEVDRIVWTAIPDNGQRVAALLHGEADLVQAVPADAPDALRATPGLKVAETPSGGVFWLGFNQELEELPGSDVRGRNPFRDHRVREAVYRAISVDNLIRDALHGGGVPAGMIVAPGVNGWSEELDRHPPREPDRARAMLAAAGYPDGFALRLSCSLSQEAPCRNVAGQLSRVGLKVEPDVRPEVEYSAMMDGNTAGFYFDNLSALTSFDSAELFRVAFHTGGWYAPGYTTPELDDKIEAIERELSSPIRDALIEQVWRQLASDVVVAPLYRPMLIWAMRDWFDVPINALNIPWFWQARVANPAAR